MSEGTDITSRQGLRLSRRAALVGLGASVVGLVGVAGVGARGQRQRPKYRQVTKTFRQFTPISIPGSGFADPYPSRIRVRGFKPGAKVTDVNVILHGVTHPELEDVDILLQAPTGHRCIVVSDAGDTASSATLTFADGAARTLGIGEADVASGSYRPVNYDGGDPDFSTAEPVRLARFDGLNPNGTWELFVYDDSAPYDGAITGGWSLRITVKERR